MVDEKFREDVKQELQEMQALGINVPKKAFELADDAEEMAEYESMSVSDCADLLITLSL